MKKEYNYLIRFSVLVLVLVWCTGFSIISLYPQGTYSVGYPFFKYCYSLVCHQQPDKSFTFNNISFLVCARCTGIYLGALLTSLYFLLVPRKISIGIKGILLSLLPMLADVILYNFGAYRYSPIIAFLTGIFSGSFVFVYILGSLEKLYFEIIGINEQK